MYNIGGDDPQTTATNVQNSSPPPMTPSVDNKVADFSIQDHNQNHHLLSNYNNNNNNLSEQPLSGGAAATPTTTMDYELEQEYTAHLMQEVLQNPNWDPTGGGVSVHEMQDMISNSHEQEAQFYHHQQQQQQQEQQMEMQQHNFHQGFDSSTTFTNQLYPQQTPAAPTPDLLNLLHLPMLPNSSSISFTNPNSRNYEMFRELPTDGGSGLNALYDHPALHLNLPPQTPIFRELSHSMQHTYEFTGGGSSSSFGAAMDEGIGGGVGAYHHHVHQLDGDDERRVHYENSILDFRREMNNTAGLRNKNGGHDLEGRGGPPNHEKQRRQQFNHKFKVLGSLLPNPSKTDRASVVGEAIDYIKELKRRVEELKFLVDKKRCAKERNKKPKIEQEGGEMESSSMNNKQILNEQAEPSFNGATRSSWLQRKSKETKVDVRIIDDEVTIKLVQRKNVNCLLSVSILDELQLDLLHVSGGNIGDYYSFLFNTKIYEGSSTHAAAIANKLMEGVDKQNAALPPNSY